MFCIRNSEGLYFSGFDFAGIGKMKPTWNRYRMTFFTHIEEANESLQMIEENSCENFEFEILPVKIG